MHLRFLTCVHSASPRIGKDERDRSRGGSRCFPRGMVAVIIQSGSRMAGRNVNGYENSPNVRILAHRPPRKKSNLTGDRRGAITIPNDDDSLLLLPFASPSEAAYTLAVDAAATMSRRRGQQWQNPSIVLKSRRTNVRPNSSINLQVNQGYLFPYARLSPTKEEEKEETRIRRRRASFYALDRRVVCRASDSAYIHLGIHSRVCI